MKRVSERIQAKPRISIQNILNVWSLASFASEEKDNSRRQKAYLKDMVSELAIVHGKMRTRDLKYLNELLNHVGMINGDAVETPDDSSFQKFNEQIVFLSALAGLTPGEVKDKISLGEFNQWAIELLKRELKRVQDMIYAYHAPEKFNKEIMNSLRQLNSKLNGTKKIESKKEGKLLRLTSLKKQRV